MRLSCLLHPLPRLLSPAPFFAAVVAVAITVTIARRPVCGILQSNLWGAIDNLGRINEKPIHDYPPIKIISLRNKLSIIFTNNERSTIVS